MKKVLQTVVLVSLLSISSVIFADSVKGRIQYISHKAHSIQVGVKGKPSVVVKFDKNTQFVNGKGIKELGTNDLIKVEYTPDQAASRITKVVFGLPPGVEISTKEMEAIIHGDQDYLLVDVRPARRFGDGHIPTAISIFAKELEKHLDQLPKDKSTLLVFYCGGPTCPYTGIAVEIALKHGYTNVKGFQGGMPHWKKAKKPVHASASWLAKNLDEHHVIFDVRSETESSKRHIKTAVAMPAEQFKAMTKGFIKEKKVAKLPGVSDRKAPIIVYGNSDMGKDVLSANKEIKKWGYKSVAILEGGFEDWIKQGRPVDSGAAGQKIVYTRKLKKGAVPRSEFAKLEKGREHVALVDVRTPKETSKGTLKGKGALAIPLDELEANLDKLTKREEIVTYCSNGIRAEMAYEVLKSKGFEKVRFLNETLAIKTDGSYSIE